LLLLKELFLTLFFKIWFFQTLSSDEHEVVVTSTSTCNFIKEAKLVSKFWVDRVDEEKSLSEANGEQVQTTRKAGVLLKLERKVIRRPQKQVKKRKSNESDGFVLEY